MNQNQWHQQTVGFESLVSNFKEVRDSYHFLLEELRHNILELIYPTLKDQVLSWSSIKELGDPHLGEEAIHRLLFEDFERVFKGFKGNTKDDLLPFLRSCVKNDFSLGLRHLRTVQQGRLAKEYTYPFYGSGEETSVDSDSEWSANPAVKNLCEDSKAPQGSMKEFVDSGKTIKDLANDWAKEDEDNVERRKSREIIYYEVLNYMIGELGKNKYSSLKDLFTEKGSLKMSRQKRKHLAEVANKCGKTVRGYVNDLKQRLNLDRL